MTIDKKTPAIDEIAKVCSTCGNCLFSCPVYNARLMEPYSPRGKVNMIKALVDGRLDADRKNTDLVYNCLLCGSCVHTCTKGVAFVDMMIKYRNLLSRGGHIPLLKKIILFFYQSAIFKKFTWVVDILVKTPLGRMVTIPRRRKADRKPSLWAPKKGHTYDILLFPGCVLNYFYPALIEKTTAFLQDNGFSVAVADGSQCCGFPYLTQGWRRKYKSLRKKNEKLFSRVDFKYLVAPCGTCLMALEDYDLGGEKEVFELTRFIYTFIKDAPVKSDNLDLQKGPVTYHDPCHDLKILQAGEEPRHFMRRLGNRFVDDKAALCCGFGGIFSVGFPDTSKKILQKKADHLDHMGVGTVVTACPGCYLYLRENLAQDVKFFIELF